MKTLLATLLVASSGYLLAPPRVEAPLSEALAQNSQHSEALIQNPGANVHAQRVKELSESREKLIAEQRSLREQMDASIRDMDSRQKRLKLEMDELAAKRAALERSFAQRWQDLQTKIRNVEEDIYALKTRAAS